MLYVGYPCIGKSSIAGKNNYVDLESSYFNDGSENWIERYVNVANDLSNQGFNVFISSHKKVRDFLNNNSIEFICIYPHAGLFDFWFNRAAERYKRTPSEKNLRALERITKHFHEDIRDLEEESYRKIIHKSDVENKSFNLIEFLSRNNTVMPNHPSHDKNDYAEQLLND